VSDGRLLPKAAVEKCNLTPVTSVVPVRSPVSPAILLFTLPWLLFAHLFVILYEEPHLRATFGTAYDAYCRSVRRWLPRRVPAA